MSVLTIQDVSRRSGLSEPTLGYYEQVGLISPVERDPGSGHHLYREEDVDTLQALACLRAMGVSIEDMRTSRGGRAWTSRLADHAAGIRFCRKIGCRGRHDATRRFAPGRMVSCVCGAARGVGRDRERQPGPGGTEDADVERPACW
jgi:hypothetical protein